MVDGDEEDVCIAQDMWDRDAEFVVCIHTLVPEVIEYLKLLIEEEKEEGTDE